MYCRMCGAENKDGAAFCKECGASIGKVTADVAGTSNAVAHAANAAGATSDNPMKKAGLSKPLIAGGAAAAVAIAAAAGFGVYKVFFEPYPINEETFPDQAFRSYVSDTFDVDKNGELSRDEANSVEYIGKWNNDMLSYNEPVSDMDITSFEGIGYFKNLKSLVANDNYVSELDLSKNRQLEYVVVNDATLSALDVSGCSKLHDVWVNTNAAVTGSPIDMSTTHLVTDAKASLMGSDERELAFDYALDGRLVQKREIYDDSTYSAVTYTYDENGKLTQTNYDSRDSSSRNTYEYDDDGHLIGKETTDEKPIPYQKDVYSYDEAGRVTSYEAQYEGSPEDTFNYVYNDEGRLDKVEVVHRYESSYDLHGTIDFKYDEAGNPTSVTCKVTNEPAWGYGADLSYDESGNLISLVKRDYDGDVLYKYRYEFSDDGLEAKRYAGSEEYPTVIKYDKGHRVISEISYNEYGEATSEKKYAYTSEGLLTSATETIGMENDPIKSTYSFATIAHYGKLATTKTVQFADLLAEPYEPDGGAYCPDAELYLTRYEEAVVGVSHPYPSNLNFYLLPS